MNVVVQNKYLIGFLYLIHVFDATSIETATTVSPNVHDILNSVNISHAQKVLNASRRIIGGEKVTGNRPYMVYLKLPPSNSKHRDYQHWLCGGVIVHEEYILTSAACIEDAKHFYVISGTYKYSAEFDRYNNPCIKNGAKKAIWKCIPKNYVYDGHENDNLRWMNNDIAIVKVEDEFNFYRLIRGCDFIPQLVAYNNHSKQLENPGVEATIVGWGSTEKYSEVVNFRSQAFSQDLLAANVLLIDKRSCKRRWGRRYHNIIDNYMICSKDNIPDLSEYCQEKYVDCTDVMYSGEINEDRRRRLLPKFQNGSRRRLDSGGFCENDHGGPLVYGSGADSVVIGIISACLVKEESNICYGPFLYTSVFKNRILITCAIYKDISGDCNKLFRSSETYTETDMNWADHPDGPAKNELLKMRRNEAKNHSELNATELGVTDKIIEKVIFGSFDQAEQKN